MYQENNEMSSIGKGKVNGNLQRSRGSSPWVHGARPCSRSLALLVSDARGLRRFATIAAADIRPLESKRQICAIEKASTSAIAMVIRGGGGGGGGGAFLSHGRAGPRPNSETRRERSRVPFEILGCRYKIACFFLTIIKLHVLPTILPPFHKEC